MAINVNRVYPPIVNSSTAAFNKDVDFITLNFTVPMAVNYSDVGFMSIRIVQLANNKTVVDTSTYYDGIIYKEKPTSSNNGVYSISINKNEIQDGWKANTFYKIQIRFAYGELFDTTWAESESDRRTEFFTWKKLLTSTNAFSEWSNVIVTKAINPPTVDILNNLDSKFLFSTAFLKYSDNVEHTRFPKIQGGYYNDSEEPLDKYRFRLYEGRYSTDPIEDTDVNMYLNSDWIQFNGSGNEKYTAVVEYTFKQPLAYLGAVYYTVFFDTVSKNEYYKTSKPYTFTVTEGVLNSINHIDLVVKDNTHKGIYADRFSGSGVNTFAAYKKLMDFPVNSIYIESQGSDIIYTTTNSRSFTKAATINSNEFSTLEYIYLNEDCRFYIENYDKNNVEVYCRLQYVNDTIDTDKTAEENTTTSTRYLLYGQDFTIGDTEYDISVSYDGEKAKTKVLRLTLKTPIENIAGGSIYIYLKSDRHRLTLEERERAANEFENALRCDENGTLEVWMRNNCSYIETEMFDDIMGFSNYEITTRANTLDGIYYLIRSDERSNYAIWEDLAKFDFYNVNDFDNRLTLLYEDFTIESGIKYKYALQRESALGYRSPPRFEYNSLESSPEHWSNFQYTYIYANGIQVRLDLDVKIQQFKHTRLFQKQDSLNSKYPVILRNSIANYGEFSLGGKITLHSDADNSFLLRLPEEYNNLTGLWSGGYYYNNDLVISPDKYMDLASRYKYSIASSPVQNRKDYDGGEYDESWSHIIQIDGTNIETGQDNTKGINQVTDTMIRESPEYYKEVRTTKRETNPVHLEAGDWKQGYSTFNFNHTNENIFMERMYRKYVEEFLNNGGYKLYKSPTEGNMIVTLVNVSLVPNQQLGRLIADFNSTVYEVAENTAENIKLYDINPLDVITNNMYLSFGDTGSRYRTVVGQVSGAYDGKYAKRIRISPTLYKQLYDSGLKPGDYFTYAGSYYYTYKPLPLKLLNIIYNYIHNLPQYEIARKAELEKLYNDEFALLDNQSESYSTELLVLQEKYNKLYSNLNNEVNILNQITNESNPYFSSVEDNIIDWIKQREEIELSDERIYQVKNVSSIWVELYPKYDLEQEIINLKAKTYGTKLSKLLRQMKIAQYELALKQYDVSQSNIITMIINGKEIAMMPGRVYHLDNTNIDTMYLKYTRPVLVNYVAQLEEVDNIQSITLAKQELNDMGQIGGVFTTTNHILNNHHPERDLNSLIALEQYNYNLYQTLDILGVIKEKVKTKIYNMSRQTGTVSFDVLEKSIDEFLADANLASLSYEEQIQKAKEILKQYKPLLKMTKNTTTDYWVDSNDNIIVYKFEGLEKLEIEADQHSEIIFNNKRTYYDGKTWQDLPAETNIARIGSTDKFVLQVESTDDINMLKYITSCNFTQPTYAIINYNAVVSLEIKGNPLKN